MTRKRYVKLLMACGYPRNGCNGVAKTARTVSASYREDLVLREFGLRMGGRHSTSAETKRFCRCAADILRRALYGEVAHE